MSIDDSDSSSPQDSLPPNESLPPVEPPDASFLMKLIGIPALIVSSLVGGYFLFLWLVGKGNDVEGYLRALQRDTPARWHAAMSLNDLLRTTRDDGLRHDAKTAAALGELLQKELASGRVDKSELQLRSYLCSALGEFRVPGVLPVLEQAAASGKTAEENAVRFAALRAIAVYLDANPGQRADEAEKLQAVIDQAAESDQPLLRSTAAFAYGALGTPAAGAGLNRLLADTTPDVRYNAALMLARQGQSAAIDVLAEMLDPATVIIAANEEDEKGRDAKRATILVNALRGVDALAEAKPPVDLAKLRPAVEKLRAADVPANIKLQATETLQRLDAARPK